MKADKPPQDLIDANTVESVLSTLSRFGSVPGCLPLHGHGCCARYGGCCNACEADEPEE